VITREQNERLTQVRPGSPMGQLMRRYWQPVAASADLADARVKAVRILGEDLVLYRDRCDRLGLLGERCPHMGVALVYGIPEPEGLRCCYHGWMFDRAGRCIHLGEDAMTPDPTLMQRVRVTAYPVQELGGLIFAYLGPEPAPLLPRWEPLVEVGVYHAIGSTSLPCNWLQCLEDQVGDMHVEWMHSRFTNWVLERMGREDRRRTNPDYIGRSAAEDFSEFDRFEFGMLKQRAGAEDANPIVVPNVMIGNQIVWYVPVDDTHTWSVTYKTHHLPPGVDLPDQHTVPVFEYPLPGLDAAGRPTSDVSTWEGLDVNAGQDRMMLYARGAIADRTREELGTGSKGIVLLRELLEENMQRVERGEDPIGLIRDPDRNHRLRLYAEPESGNTAARRAGVVGTIPGSRADTFDPVLRAIRERMEEPKPSAATA
jgi:5,5'-dehydrodivanillate O-demethylase oxygenase subunit